MLFYTFEIYFDFSGYSDMAVGVSMMLNIDLPINFDSPYKALSIRDFWKRWHISLTKFFTKYVYIPLGGSRKGLFFTYLNTMIIFVISGIWHGANWTFPLWGILHGLMMVFDRIFGKLEEKIFEPVRWAVSFSASMSSGCCSAQIPSDSGSRLSKRLHSLTAPRSVRVCSTALFCQRQAS